MGTHPAVGESHCRKPAGFRLDTAARRDAANRANPGVVGMAQVHEPDPRLREQSMGELFKQLSDDMSKLVRQELKLAQAEMTEKGKQAGIGVGMFGAAAIVGMVALLTFTAFVVAALATGMDVWLAALIVTVVYAIAAGGLALIAKQKVAEAAPACARTNRRDRKGGRAMGEDPAAIREEIEGTRARMGDTVDALGYKADVPSRAKESITGKVQGAKAKITGAGSQISDAAPGAGDVKAGCRSRAGEPAGARDWRRRSRVLGRDADPLDQGGGRAARSSGRPGQGAGQADRSRGARARQAGGAGHRPDGHRER